MAVEGGQCLVAMYVKYEHLDVDSNQAFIGFEIELFGG